MLILAGTAISIAINGGDIFGKASQARTGWNTAVAEEEHQLSNVLQILNGMTRGATGLTLDYELGDLCIFLKITGLEPATDEQRLEQLAKYDGISVEDERANLNQWADDARLYGDEALDTYQEQLIDYSNSLGFIYEPFIIIAIQNDDTIFELENYEIEIVYEPEYIGYVLMFPEIGTYNITVRSESGKIGQKEVDYIELPKTSIITRYETFGVLYSEGMTWREWIASGHGIGFEILNTTQLGELIIRRRSEGFNYVCGNDSIVRPNDTIENITYGLVNKVYNYFECLQSFKNTDKDTYAKIWNEPEFEELKNFWGLYVNENGYIAGTVSGITVYLGHGMTKVHYNSNWSEDDCIFIRY